MKLQKLLIAGGNSTLLVWDCPLPDKDRIIEMYLGEVEQIGFVAEAKESVRLEMMGNELCINGTIALASLLGDNKVLETSGMNGKVEFLNEKETTTINIPLPFEVNNNIVLLSGIGFIYESSGIKNKKQLLSKLCDQYQLPAFGTLEYSEKSIKPSIYVAKTNTLFNETACGSGSIAFNLITGICEVKQPTGEVIRVEKKSYCFSVSAEVKLVEELNITNTSFEGDAFAS